MRSTDQLRVLAESYLGELALTPELHGQAESVRYALVGGKRVRAVICLATAEAAGVDAEVALPAAASLELVHAFSLVHDDLPALDNDAERRGRLRAQQGRGRSAASGRRGGNPGARAPRRGSGRHNDARRHRRRARHPDLVSQSSARDVVAGGSAHAGVGTIVRKTTA